MNSDSSVMSKSTLTIPTSCHKTADLNTVVIKLQWWTVQCRILHSVLYSTQKHRSKGVRSGARGG